MNPVTLVMLAGFLVSILCLALVFVFNPLVLWLVSRFRKRPLRLKSDQGGVSVSMVIVAHNPGESIDEKLKNSLALEFPEAGFEIVFFSDGSTDDTVARASRIGRKEVRVFQAAAHHGKNRSLNEAVRRCRHDILVFSDVDTCLRSDALCRLLPYFADPDVGGVCGKKEFCRAGNGFGEAQRKHGGFDGMIKLLESRIGSISSNDGTLYALRRELYQEIPPAVTDDLFICLATVRQGRRFMYEPAAVARLAAPSRNPVHELQRRRRIVNQSLSGIFLLRELLNPFRCGYFSLRLFVNKVMRRFIPLFLIGLGVTNAYLVFLYPLAIIPFVLQIAFYTVALGHVLFSDFFNGRRGILCRLTALPYYFCIGNYGTLLGVMDFLRKRRVDKWIPYSETKP